MSQSNIAKSLICELVSNNQVNSEVFILKTIWTGPPPKSGQFFMIKPERSSVFLPRPISVFEYSEEQNTLKFLIAKRGKGTEELSLLKEGEQLRLTGPLGNSWNDFLPETVQFDGKAALVGGSVGVAPLAALVAEKPDFHFHFYAGFKSGFNSKEEENTILGAAVKTKKLIVTAEDGKNALNGLVVDYLFEPQNYDVIFACGSTPMLKAVKKKCDARNVPCFISMESRFACGAGACLGCTINTVNGNRRCCADGPIFSAREVIFDE